MSKSALLMDASTVRNVDVSTALVNLARKMYQISDKVDLDIEVRLFHNGEMRVITVFPYKEEHHAYVYSQCVAELVAQAGFYVERDDWQNGVQFDYFNKLP